MISHCLISLCMLWCIQIFVYFNSIPVLSMEVDELLHDLKWDILKLNFILLRFLVAMRVLE